MKLVSLCFTATLAASSACSSGSGNFNSNNGQGPTQTPAGSAPATLGFVSNGSNCNPPAGHPQQIPTCAKVQGSFAVWTSPPEAGASDFQICVLVRQASNSIENEVTALTGPVQINTAQGAVAAASNTFTLHGHGGDAQNNETTTLFSQNYTTAPWGQIFLKVSADAVANEEQNFSWQGAPIQSCQWLQ